MFSLIFGNVPRMCVCAQICSCANFTATLFMQSKTNIINFDFLIFVPKF